MAEVELPNPEELDEAKGKAFTAIVMSSISILSSSRQMFFFSLILAALGALCRSMGLRLS
jgi:hypothetical protein